MTIDKQKLKALARATDDCENEQAWSQFMEATSPANILALLAEIERLESRVSLLQKYEDDCLHLMRGAEAERDQLKAENEALRTGQAIKRLSCAEVREAYNGAYYQPRDIGSDGEQCRAGVLAVIEVAMGKEASHG